MYTVAEMHKNMRSPVEQIVSKFHVGVEYSEQRCHWHSILNTGEHVWSLCWY